MSAYTNHGKSNSGRKSALTERGRRALRRTVSENHRTTAAQVDRTAELNIHLEDPVSTETVRRDVSFTNPTSAVGLQLSDLVLGESIVNVKKKMDFDISTDLHIFSTSLIQKQFFFLPVSLYECTYVQFLPLDRFTDFIRIRFLRSYRSVLDEYKHSIFKIGTLHWGPQTQHIYSHQNGPNDFDWISVIQGYNLPEQDCIRTVQQNIFTPSNDPNMKMAVPILIKF
jgi:hypothetical protein